MQDETSAKVVFLISILSESEELIIHVIGEEILDRELRFPVSSLEFYRDKHLSGYIVIGRLSGFS